jgi:hypothetical protein
MVELEAWRIDCDDPPTFRCTQPQAHALLWQGVIPSDGSGPQPNGYFVRLYADGQAHCACPDWYFRGLQRGDLFYSCKHVLRARARIQS